jgi:hypothetical protein
MVAKPYILRRGNTGNDLTTSLIWQKTKCATSTHQLLETLITPRHFRWSMKRRSSSTSIIMLRCASSISCLMRMSPMKLTSPWGGHLHTPTSALGRASVASNFCHTRKSWRKHLGFMDLATLLQNSFKTMLVWMCMDQILKGMDSVGTNSTYTGARSVSLSSASSVKLQLTENRLSLTGHVKSHLTAKKPPLRRQRSSTFHRHGVDRDCNMTQSLFRD